MKLLELLHTNVCGPIKTSSFGNNRYFLLFMDDFSRNTWVYNFLKRKSEAFGGFQKFMALVKKQNGHVFKALRSNRGGEFMSNNFSRFL